LIVPLRVYEVIELEDKFAAAHPSVFNAAFERALDFLDLNPGRALKEIGGFSGRMEAAEAMMPFVRPQLIAEKANVPKSTLESNLIFLEERKRQERNDQGNVRLTFQRVALVLIAMRIAQGKRSQYPTLFRRHCLALIGWWKGCLQQLRSQKIGADGLSGAGDLRRRRYHLRLPRRPLSAAEKAWRERDPGGWARKVMTLGYQLDRIQEAAQIMGTPTF
jgi:hypothetical protein